MDNVKTVLAESSLWNNFDRTQHCIALYVMNGVCPSKQIKAFLSLTQATNYPIGILNNLMLLPNHIINKLQSKAGVQKMFRL